MTLAENPATIKDKLSKKTYSLQAIRWALIAEIDAVNFYEQLAENLPEDSPERKVLEHVINEEKEHIGEFLGLLLHMDPTLREYMKKGFKELEEETGLQTEI